MGIKELRRRLERIREEHADDPEAIHSKMDDALLDYVDDPEVRRIYGLDEKWCA